LKPSPLARQRRELRNIVERLLLLADSEVDAATVRLALPASTPAIAATDAPLSDRLDAAERLHHPGRARKTQLPHVRDRPPLGLERSHLYKKCGAPGIDQPGAKMILH